MIRQASTLPKRNSVLRWSLTEILHGKLWPIMVALIFIVSCVFAVASLAEKMQQLVVDKSKDSLTASRILETAHPIRPEFLAQAEKQGLPHAQMTQFSTMLFRGDDMQLVNIKAVNDSYPLRGDFRLQGSAQQPYSHLPPSRTGDLPNLWLSQQLQDKLTLSIGEEVDLGDGRFVVAGTLIKEPGLTFNPFQQMPTVYIHLNDVKATKAIQVGSRVHYHFYLDGDTSALDEFEQAVSISEGDEWRDKNSTDRAVNIFEKTQQYFSLTIAIIILMASLTLVLTCQHYATTRQLLIATLKSLGASKQWIVRWLACQLLCLFLMAMVLGCLLGYGLNFILLMPLADLFSSQQGGIDFSWFGVFCAFLVCLLISIPAIGIAFIELVLTPPNAVLQGNTKAKRKAPYVLVLFPILAMLVTYYNNPSVLFTLLALFALFIVLGVLGFAITSSLSTFPLIPSVQLALNRISRSRLMTIIQFGALSLSLTLLAVLYLVRSDLFTSWQQILPHDADNMFALNISTDEKADYQNFLIEQRIPHSRFFPVVRGRLTKINGVDAISAAGGKKASNALQRELNFTWLDTLPHYNAVVDGQWGAMGAVSVEQKVASDLGITLGDTIDIMVNGLSFNAKVNSIRKVNWQDMKPNFYFIFSPDIFKDMDASWMTSFNISDQQNDQLDILAKNHPTVSLLDIRTIGQNIQAILSQMTLSISTFAMLGVLSGLLLILTLLRLSIKQRTDEIRLYRTLGSSKRQITHTLWAEYGMIGLIGAAIACVGAELIVNLIMIIGFEQSFRWHPLLWVVLPLGLLLLLSLSIYASLKELLTTQY